MTTIDLSALENALAAAFHGGERTRRELRLSEAEAEHLRAFALLTPMPAGGTGDKSWYEVSLKGVLAK